MRPVKCATLRVIRLTLRHKLWGASIASNPPTVTYASVMPETAGEDAERGVLQWLNKVVGVSS